MATKATTKKAVKKPTKSAVIKAAEAKTEAATARKEAVRARAEAAKAKAIVARGHGSGFVNFIREQGVIGLAVGLAIGAAAGDTVKKLVEGFISPVVQFLVGSQKGLESAVWHTELAGRTADFKWGAFVSSLITLLATAFVIYLIVHFAKLDKLDRKKD